MNARKTLRTTKLLGVAASLVAAAGFVLGCSSSVGSNAGTTVAGTQVSVPVLITDAPSDQVIAFTLTINSITLTDSAGKTASVLSTPSTVEICHLNGVQAPLVTAAIPQDTYVSALITFSSPQITYINSSGQSVSVSPTLSTNSFTFTFTSPGGSATPGFTVSNSSSALVVDLLVGQSVNISGTAVTVAPVFAIKPVPVSTSAPTAGQNGTGMQGVGTVVSVTGTTLVVQPPSGQSVTFTLNNSTVLQGFTGITQLVAGNLVQVDFIVQSGGIYLATRIQLAPPPPTGQPPVNLLSGPVTSVSIGNFKMALMQGIGPSVPVSATAVSLYTINYTSATTWAASPQFISITNLPFTPSFSPTNLSAGQAVGVVASSISGTTATAAQVYLMPQTLGGTVTAIKAVGAWTAYTLTLPAGSAFASLSGASTITVYTNTNTAPPPPSATGSAPPAIAVGATVRFNGLVFNLGAGNFAMIAGCSPDGPPGV